MSSKNLVKKDEAATSLTETFDPQDVGAGLEGADTETFAIPFLRVLQAGSPQCNEADAAYVAGAKPGMLFNTVTQKTYEGEKGVIFLPCAFRRRYLRWAPRAAEGRGFKGELAPEAVARMRQDGAAQELEGRLYATDDGAEVNPKRSDRLSDTRSHYGLVVDEAGAASAVLLALSSTQIRKSKQLMSLLSAAKVGAVTPPTWMNRVRITTVHESNDQGSWYGVRFAAEGFLEDPALYAAGKLFHDSIVAGEVKVNYSEGEGDEADASAGKF